MLKAFYISLIMLLGGISISLAQVTVTQDVLPDTNSTDSTAVLNNQLRLNQNAINSIGGYFNANGYLLPQNGGTGTNISTFPNGSLLIYDSNNVGIGTFSQGTSGEFLQSQGINLPPTWAIPTDTNTSNLAFHYQAAVEAATTNSGEVRDASLTAATPTGAFRYLAGVSTPIVMLTGKYTKITGVTTVTIFCQLWISTADPNNSAKGTFDINGLSVDIESTNVNVPTWYSGTLDVSSLVDNTIYDITISLSKGLNDSGNVPRMGSIFFFNS